MAAMAGAPTAAAERKLAKDQNEEYHDPFDDWGVRDILLSLVPYIIVFAFKDVALKAAFAVAIAWAGWVLLMRLTLFHGWRKLIWPVIDIFSLITFAVLRGVSENHFEQIWRWVTVIVPAVFAVVGIISLIFRRPFTAHYARYPKFDRGGRELFHGDASFRRTADLATLGWISAWTASCLLSLIPVLLNSWYWWGALNIVFNYVLPFVFIFSALVFMQLMGSWYRATVYKHTRDAVTTPAGRGAGYPAGVTEPAMVGPGHGVGHHGHTGMAAV